MRARCKDSLVLHGLLWATWTLKTFPVCVYVLLENDLTLTIFPWILPEIVSSSPNQNQKSTILNHKDSVWVMRLPFLTLTVMGLRHRRLALKVGLISWHLVMTSWWMRQVGETDPTKKRQVAASLRDLRNRILLKTSPVVQNENSNLSRILKAC